MRLIQRILQHPVHMNPADPPAEISPELREGLEPCAGHGYIADDAWAIYWQSANDVWSYKPKDGHFGDLRPPVDTMWIEAKMPPVIFADGVWQNLRYEDTTYAGSTVQRIDDPDPDQAGGHVLRMIHWMWRPGVYPAFLNAVSIVWLDSDGRYRLHTIEHSKRMFGELGPEVVQSVEGSSSRPALLALSLLNTSNCRVADEADGFKRLVVPGSDKAFAGGRFIDHDGTFEFLATIGS